MQTAKELQDKRAAIQEEANSFIGKLKGDLNTAEKERFTEGYQNQLRDQIESGSKTYGDLLSRLDKDIVAAQERETREAAQKQQAQQLTAAEEKQRIYDQLKAVWIDQKGDPEVFEQQFPQLYAAQMAKRTTANSIDQDPGRRKSQSVITSSF